MAWNRWDAGNDQLIGQFHREHPDYPRQMILTVHGEPWAWFGGKWRTHPSGSMRLLLAWLAREIDGQDQRGQAVRMSA